MGTTSGDGWAKVREGGADALLTAKELAQVLGLAVRTLKKQRAQGRGVPFVRVGERAIRYRVGDVRRFLRERRVQTATATATAKAATAAEVAH